MSCSVSLPSVEAEFYYERFFHHSPHSFKRKMRQFRESRATISRWHVTIACDVHCVHSWPDGFISAQVADTPSAGTQLGDREQSMSTPEICQNKQHLQNKSVLLMDNSGKNKQRWLLFRELFIAGAAGAAVLQSFMTDPHHFHICQHNSVKETAAVMCIKASACSPMRPDACLSRY